MKSFGRLLRKMRGVTPLEALAAQTALDAGYLASIEAGRRLADEFIARLILAKGFALTRREVDRVMLGVQLYDLGLRDNELRQLVIDLILKTLPDRLRERLRELYRNHAK